MHWFLVFLTILPEVLIFWTSTHSGTWRVRTLLTNCAINQIDAIEWRKINKTGIIYKRHGNFSHRLKKSTTWTANQSLKSSPGGNCTTFEKYMGVFNISIGLFHLVLKTYSSQINSRVEWSLSLFVQGIFQGSWLKLLFRSERFPFVEERTKIGCKIHFREWLLLQIPEKEQLSIRFVFDFCQLTSNQNAAFERLREIKIHFANVLLSANCSQSRVKFQLRFSNCLSFVKIQIR